MAESVTHELASVLVRPTLAVDSATSVKRANTTTRIAIVISVRYFYFLFSHVNFQFYNSISSSRIPRSQTSQQYVKQ